MLPSCSSVQYGVASALLYNTSNVHTCSIYLCTRASGFYQSSSSDTGFAWPLRPLNYHSRLLHRLGASRRNGNEAARNGCLYLEMEIKNVEENLASHASNKRVWRVWTTAIRLIKGRGKAVLRNTCHFFPLVYLYGIVFPSHSENPLAGFSRFPCSPYGSSLRLVTHWLQGLWCHAQLSVHFAYKHLSVVGASSSEWSVGC